MAVSLSLHVKQTQRLAMTQSLRQSIEMLQLSTIELAETVSQELATNPVLEEDIATQDDNQVDELYTDISLELSGESSKRDDIDIRNEKYADVSDTGFQKSYDDDKKQQAIENAFREKESLSEHLSNQIAELKLSETEQANLLTLATVLSDDGFLTEEDKSYCLNSGMSEEDFNSACKMIQKLDPVGCGTYTVNETLLTQALINFPNDDLLITLLEHHFEDLSKLFYDKIARQLKVDVEQIVEKNSKIQTLSPYPGRKFSKSNTNYVIPELEVTLIGDEIILMFYDELIPKISINSYYTDMLDNKNTQNDIKKYLREKVNSAKYLIRSISGRKETIEKVVRAIMDKQREFLKKGPGNLNPLVHADIAAETGFNESTISRVASNKYIQTKFGIFELKYFFVSKISGGVEESSSDKVMKLIRDIVINEHPDQPYTDEEIVKRLENTGIQAARRTVAKYRGILGIPPSSKRKRINKLKME
jgi:RNA polymerase sigma-54 factor